MRFALVFALLVSTIGDEIYLAAMMLHLAESGSVVTSLFLLSQLLPAVLLVSVAGYVVDRFDSAKVLIICQLLQAATLFALSFVSSVPLFIAGSVLLGCLFAFSQPALWSLVPLIAERFGQNIQRLNAWTETTQRLALIVGPAIGGTLIDLGGLRLALLLDGASFLVPVVLLYILKIHRPAHKHGLENPFSGVGQGFSLLHKHRVLGIALAVTVSYLCMSLVNVAQVFLITRVMGGSGTVYGLITALWGIGMVVGAVLASRSWAQNRELPLAVWGLFGIGGSLMVTGGFPVLWIVMASELFGGVSNGLHNVGYRTLLHHRLPNEIYGRGFAAIGAMTNTAVALGYLLSSPFAAQGSTTVYITGGALTVLASLLVFVMSARAQRLLKKSSENET